jgi:DNA-binding CsgD family transcriptional regulator
LDDSAYQQLDLPREQNLQHFIGSLETLRAFYEQPHLASALLCQQIALITQGHMQLILNAQQPTNPSDISVHYGKMQYGVIHLNVPSPQASLMQEAHRLAEACSWLLYGLRAASYLRKQLKGINLERSKVLTEQELAVLTLMEQKKKSREIAQLLHITPQTVHAHQKNIYERLGVHNQQEAVLAANMLGLISQKRISSR